MSAVFDALRQVNQELRAAARGTEQRLGITGAQLAVLHALADAPAQSLGELAARTFTRHSSASVIVRRLVAMGLIIRRPAPDDARRVTLTLSRTGRELVRNIPEAVQARLLASARRLPSSKLNELATGLRALARELSRVNREASGGTAGGRQERVQPTRPVRDA